MQQVTARRASLHPNPGLAWVRNANAYGRDADQLAYIYDQLNHPEKNCLTAL